MRDTLQAWDEAVLLALNGQPRWLDTPAWWLTSNWAAVPVVLLIFWTLYRIGTRHGAPRRAWLGLAALILTFAGTDALSSRVMKPGFAAFGPATPKPSTVTCTTTHSMTDPSTAAAASASSPPMPPTPSASPPSPCCSSAPDGGAGCGYGPLP